MIRNYGLDIFRGMAALSVLLSHWGGWNIDFADTGTRQLILAYQNTFQRLLWAGGGVHPGVIVFIVLSGFCIHLPQALSPKKTSEDSFWWKFSLRRSFRILPVFWIALFLGLISTYIINIAPARIMENIATNDQKINRDIIFSILGVSGVARFFGASDMYPGNGPLSTVAVEILLYVSYPLFLLIQRLYGSVTVALFGLLLYFFIVGARFYGIDPDFLHGTWFEFSIYWIIGMISACIYASNIMKYENNSKKLALLLIIGYVFYFFIISVVHIKGFHVVSTLLLAVLTGGFLIYLQLSKVMLTQRRLRVAALLATFGARSYSLYVVHTPIIFATIWFLNRYTNFEVYSYPWVSLLFVFIGAELMFKFIEQPSHKYAKRWR